jgi:glycosyltransferase involved in cell wall biosynthesis
VSTSEPVSVVVPAYNAERYVAEAIASALVQRLPHDEIVVVDDGSTDGTAAMVEAFGDQVVLVRTERRGPGAARNAGIARARGTLLAFLDADDVWADGALEAWRRELAGSEQPDIVRGLVRQFASPEFRGAVPDGASPGLCPGAAVLTRRAWDAVGAFDEQLQAGEFLDWLLRARALGLGEVVLSEVVLWRRVHESNHTRVAQLGDYARVLKSELDRRRQRERTG